MADPQGNGMWNSGTPAVQSWPPPPGNAPQNYPRPQGTLPGPPSFSPFPGANPFPTQQAYYHPAPGPYFPQPGPPPSFNYGFNPRGYPPFAPHQHPVHLLPPGPPRPGVSGLPFPSQSPTWGAGHLVNAPASNAESKGMSGLPVTNSTTSQISVNLNSQAGFNNVGFSNTLEEGIEIIEQAISVCESHKEKSVDITELLSQIRALVSQAEETVEKISKMTLIDSTLMGRLNLATCPFDSSHRMPSINLFQHFLCCSSNPSTAPPVDAKKLISSLRYPRSSKLGSNEVTQTAQDDSTTINLQSGDTLNRNNSSFANSNFGHEIDIWGGRLCYQHSSAVVQAPLDTVFPFEPSENSLLPSIGTGSQLLAKEESTNKVDSVADVETDDELSVKKEMLEPLLPSRYWFLLRETQTWKELPTRCSSLVLQAGAVVGRTRKKLLVEWLLSQGPVHGVVMDGAMASHIYSLVKICLKSLQKDSVSMIGKLSESMKERDTALAASDGDGIRDPHEQEKLPNTGLFCLKEVKKEVTMVPMAEPESRNKSRLRSLKLSSLNCPGLFRSAHSLAAQLSSLLGSIQSKAFVLKLLKHCLVTSGPPPLVSFSSDAFPKDHINVENFHESQTLNDAASSIGDELLTIQEDPLEWRFGCSEVETAIAAVHERAVLEKYLKSINQPNKPSKQHVIKEYDALVRLAAMERRTRPNYKPVLEYDGLIWQRLNLQEKNQNKSKEELLAEKRDYKRRRMSYRGKKLKRNPTQVLHDIIEGHMEEISAAGGIGCLAKYPVDLQPPPETGEIERSGVLLALMGSKSWVQ